MLSMEATPEKTWFFCCISLYIGYEKSCQLRFWEVIHAPSPASLSKQHKLSGVLDRQFPEHDGIHDTGDGGVGANAEC